MTRTDDDSWDITESVGATALGVALARAAETDSGQPLFVDHYAQWFIDAATAHGWQPPFGGREMPEAQAQRVRALWDYAASRTKHFDEFFIAAGASGIQQAVILAAGLDARAWRLPWITDTVVFEIDQPKVLQFKAETLAARGARPAARHVAVPIDLRQDWPKALLQVGFDPTVPTAWLAEGLLPYLPAAAQDLLFERVQELSAPDSRIAVEAFGSEYFDEDRRERRRAARAEMRDASCPDGRRLTDVEDLFFTEPRTDVVEWLGGHCWVDVATITADDLMARHHRESPGDDADASSVFVTARYSGYSPAS